MSAAIITSGVEVDLLLTVISLIILLGYISEVVFKVTRIPEVLILMLLGIILGQSHLLPGAYIDTLRSLTPLFGSVALIMIMFNGGRIIKLNKTPQGNIGYLLALADTVLPAVVLSGFMYFIFHWPLIYGALLGAILGETSTIMVIPLLKRLDVNQKIYDMMFIETVFNSVFAILAFYLLLAGIRGNGFTFFSYAEYSMTYISIAVMVGIAGGLGWLFVQDLFKNARGYIATIAVAILIYAFVDFFNGAAVVAVLIYAIIIGNSGLINAYFKMERPKEEEETAVGREMEFLVRTFFFVLLGVIAYISLYYFLFALAISGILIFVRKFEIGGLMRTEQKYKDLAFSLMPRGLSAAVLASIYYSTGYLYSQQIFYISFMVIVITNISFSIATSRMAKKVPVKKEQTDTGTVPAQPDAALGNS